MILPFVAAGQSRSLADLRGVKGGAGTPAGREMIEKLRRKLDQDEDAWLRCCRAMVTAGRQATIPLVGTEAGRSILGRGGGGDETMEIDRAAEAAMLEELARRAPHPHSVVSEELGVREAGGRWTVVIDPVDGSLNAKRGLDPFSGVVAVADGPTLADVRLGYVESYRHGEAYLGVRGAGCAATRSPVPHDLASRVELILLEAGRPDRHPFDFSAMASLGGSGRFAGIRVRQLGSLALAVAQVSTGVADLVVTPVPTRAVDVAAPLLMVRESGGDAASLDGRPLWEQPLDLARHSPMIAWRNGVDGEAVLAAARRLFGS
jgi:myo-inositol-1(or 4)-monophosphatase